MVGDGDEPGCRGGGLRGEDRGGERGCLRRKSRRFPWRRGMIWGRDKLPKGGRFRPCIRQAISPPPAAAASELIRLDGNGMIAEMRARVGGSSQTSNCGRGRDPQDSRLRVLGSWGTHSQNWMENGSSWEREREKRRRGDQDCSNCGEEERDNS